MAGIAGNKATLAVAKQSAKGVTVVTPSFKNAFSGGNIAPSRAMDRLAETDSARDQGALYVASAGLEGTPEVYARPNSLGLYLGGVLGGIAAPTGTTPAITHVFTPADTLPYHTFWKSQGGILLERFSDCVIGSLTLAAEAGAPLTVAAGVQGVNYKRLVAGTDDAAITAHDGVALDARSPFSFNQVDVMLGDNQATPVLAATKAVRSFEMTIENNITAQQTDDVTMYDIAVGTREISLGFDMIFENANEYLKFHTGSNTGTQIATNIYTTKARFTFTKAADAGDTNSAASLVLDFPSIAYEEFPVEPDPGGDPIVVSARAVAQRASGVSNLVTATLINNQTSYTVSGT